MSVGHDSSMRRPTAGIDWASTEHALAIVGPDGVEVHRMLVEHTAAGLRKLLRCLQQAAVLEVGIERPDGPLEPPCATTGPERTSTGRHPNYILATYMASGT